MKILVIDSPFLPTNIGGNNFGGIETFVDAFIRNNLNYGHKIDLITTQDSEILVSNENLGVYKTELSSKAKMSELTGQPKFRFKYEQIISLISKLGINNYDLVINNSDKIKINSALYQISKKLDCHNVVTYLHNLPIFRGSENTVTKFISFKPYITFVANSTFTFNKWNNTAKNITKNENEFVCSSKVILNIDNIVPDNLDYLNNLKLNNFVIVGRVTEQKNPCAVKRLSLEMPNEFHFFGINHYDDKEAQKFATIETRNNFTFHENIPIKDKIEYIKENKLSMLSTAVWETYGITAVESFALGLPVIVLNNNDNNIVNFLKDPMINLTCDFMIGDDPSNPKDKTYGYTVCDYGIILKKNSPANMAKALVEALDKLNSIYDPYKTIEYFKSNFAFSELFALKLYESTKRN